MTGGVVTSNDLYELIRHGAAGRYDSMRDYASGMVMRFQASGRSGDADKIYHINRALMEAAEEWDGRDPLVCQHRMAELQKGGPGRSLICSSCGGPASPAPPVRVGRPLCLGCWSGALEDWESQRRRLANMLKGQRPMNIIMHWRSGDHPGGQQETFDFTRGDMLLEFGLQSDSPITNERLAHRWALRMLLEYNRQELDRHGACHGRFRILLRTAINESARQAHRWRKKNAATRRDRLGLYDVHECERCGVTGKRFGLSGTIKRDSIFRANVYGNCSFAFSRLRRGRKGDAVREARG